MEKSARDNLVKYANSHFSDDEVSVAKDFLWFTAGEQELGEMTKIVTNESLNDRIDIRINSLRLIIMIMYL